MGITNKTGNQGMGMPPGHLSKPGSGNRSWNELLGTEGSGIVQLRYVHVEPAAFQSLQNAEVSVSGMQRCLA